ncbi:BadF/BadG/BcrA/BcrD ATPase family protein [Sphaerisporangium sp. B11E5]|uniref:N-acetylglucosamine kinase n=1 Tax=Sphaerisporangium sp. B11E5 TaxID=3153563 RepID=UPI00325E3BE3
MGSPVRLVIGLDGGGTSTRCVVATPAGEIVGRGHAAGANPRSARDPGANLLRALTGALASAGPGVAGPGVIGVFGLAGASEAGRRLARDLATQAWHTAGLPGAPAVVPDILVAFTGATPEPSGTVLVAGTGAVAARIESHEIAHRADGYGWLLGDEGSGIWIGRQATHAALSALDGRGPPTALTPRILPTLLSPPDVPAPPSPPDVPAPPSPPDVPAPPSSSDVPALSSSPDVPASSSSSGVPASLSRPDVPAPSSSPDIRAPLSSAADAGGGAEGVRGGPGPEGEALAQAIIAAVYDREPARLGLLSPVVEAAAREGDHVALTILEDAAHRLVRTLEAVLPDPSLPVVLAGSLLTNPTLVAAHVRAALPAHRLLPSRDAAAGAAALALRATHLTEPEITAAHRRLLAL